jgi:hypothetical protein
VPPSPAQCVSGIAEKLGRTGSQLGRTVRPSGSGISVFPACQEGRMKGHSEAHQIGFLLATLPAVI